MAPENEENTPDFTKEQGKTGGVRGDRFACDWLISHIIPFPVN
jgi:hypothetical protein